MNSSESIGTPATGTRGTERAGHRATRAADGRGRRRRKQERSAARRWLKPVAFTTGGVLLATCGAGYLYLRHLDSNIQHAPLRAADAIAPPPPGPTDQAGHTAMNILVIGTDSRAGLDGGYGDRDNTGIGNNDVNIVLHISPDRRSAVAVNLPRDTLVDLPECKDPKSGEVFRALTHHPLNEALGRGGPGCVTSTVESITQLKIDHYALVNFQGVKDLTDAVHGVPVTLCSPINDPNSHLNLSAGPHTLDGEQGLAFVRTRDKVQDGSSLGRFTMQRAYLAALLRKVTSAGTLLDPTAAFPMIEAATRSITVDDAIAGTTKLVALADELHAIKPGAVDFVQPEMHYTPDDPNPNFRQKAAFTQPAADQLFQLVREGRPLTGNEAAAASNAPSSPAPSSPAATPSAPAQTTPSGPATPVDPSSVTVTVLNGTGAAMLATNGAQTLADLGYDASAGGGGPHNVVTSTVRYPKAAEQPAAAAIAKALGLPDSAVLPGGSGSTVVVTFGADYRPGGSGGATGTGGDAGAVDPSASPNAAPGGVTVHNGDDSGCVQGWTGSLDQ
ncbi:LCP family protein [Kitasatospora nipponensis]|uniref:LCP family protein n=1 Tax=Kitasatospora nipponensis TaxID=258049 RepID=A0ABN1T7L2_9ACTN